MQPVRLLILGTGGMAKNHAENFAAIPGVTVVAGIDTRAEQLAAFKAAHSIPHGFPSVQEAVAWGEFDAVTNVTPDAAHYATTLPFLAAGKHVLCEKPMVISLDEMDLLEEAARTHGVTIFEAFMYLHHPQTRRVIELIGEGAIGTLQTVNSWFSHWLPPSDADNVRLQAGLVGGSAWDVLVYPNSYAVAASGGQPPQAVWAQQIVGESGVDVAMRAQLHFAGDVAAQVSSGFRSPFREGAWFVGDAGILQVIEPWKPGIAGQPSRVLLTRRDDSVEEIIFPAADPYDFEVAAMEACVLDGAPPVVPLALSRAFARSMLAIYRSAASGQIEQP